MSRAARGFASCFVVGLVVVGQAWGQCTDADNDGYYGDPDCGTSRDCDDENSQVHPGAPEICDRVDNDCNVLIDESAGCECSSTEIVPLVKNLKITTPVVRMAWSGDEYGIVWWDDYVKPEAYFAHVSPEGAVTGSPIKIADGSSMAVDPVVVWADTEYGVIWSDHRDGNWELYLTRVAADGDEIGEDVRLTDAPGDSWGQAMLWDGHQYAVAWTDERDGSTEIYFAQFTKSGARVGDEIRVTSAEGDRWDIALASSGATFGLAWMDRRSGQWQPYFAKVDSAASTVGPEVKIGTEGTWWAPSIAWTGTEYGVAWATYMRGIRFRRLDESGAGLAPEVQLSANDDSAPELIWTGAEYGLAWSRASGNRMVFTRLESKGESIGSKIELDGEMLHSSLAWTGLSYAAAIGSIRDSIQFARFSCPVVVSADTGRGGNDPRHAAFFDAPRREGENETRPLRVHVSR